MTKRKPMGHDLDNLPLFAADHDIGIALLGPDRACEWPSLVPLYERQGFPKIDAVMGGRYVPAIRAFFDQQYGLAAAIPAAPDGIERPEVWTTRRRRAG